MAYERAYQAQAQMQESLLERNGIVGVAVGEKVSQNVRTGEEALVVLVERKLPIAALSLRDLLPQAVGGVSIDVVEVGYIRAYAPTPLPSPRDRYETMLGGVSIGHYKVSAGTLGAVVIDNTTGDKVILSNNHVIANSNDAVAGDPILHPAAYDDGEEKVARLLRWKHISMIGEEPPVVPPTPQRGWAEFVRDAGDVFLKLGNVNDRRLQLVDLQQDTSESSQKPVLNRIDAALGLPIDPSKFVRGNRYVGQITGSANAVVGMSVRKAGRTTDYTEGTVDLLNATVDVAYGNDKVARFAGQIIIRGNDGTFSAGGDSGSVVVDKDSQNAVGLLFAGSQAVTIANPIDEVLTELNISF